MWFCVYNSTLMAAVSTHLIGACVLHHIQCPRMCVSTCPFPQPRDRNLLLAKIL